MEWSKLISSGVSKVILGVLILLLYSGPCTKDFRTFFCLSSLSLSLSLSLSPSPPRFFLRLGGDDDRDGDPESDGRKRQLERTHFYNNI